MFKGGEIDCLDYLGRSDEIAVTREVFQHPARACYSLLLYSSASDLIWDG